MTKTYQQIYVAGPSKTTLRSTLYRHPQLGTIEWRMERNNSVAIYVGDDRVATGTYSVQWYRKGEPMGQRGEHDTQADADAAYEAPLATAESRGLTKIG